MKQLFLRFCVVGAFLATISPVLGVSAATSADYYNYYNPGYSTSYYGAPVLSQANVSVSVNQSVSITISGGTAPYTMYPSTPNLFQAVISGNIIQITGLTSGSGSISICSSGGSASGCSTLYVTVGAINYNYNNNYYPNNYYTSQISVSPTSLSLVVGNSGSAYITGAGPYYISSNPSPNIATAYISGSTLNVTGVSYGNDTITVCQNSGQCAYLYVTVAYNGNVNNNPTPVQAQVTFSQNNPSLAIGQTANVAVNGLTPYGYYNNSNYANSYYIAYNSNSSGLQATLSGSNLTLQGLAVGNVVLVVCTTATNCGALMVSVGSTTYGASYNPTYNTPVVTAGNWYVCANENQFCSFTGTKNVQYGANGMYTYRTLTNGALCSNALFGDPIFGVAKRCSLSY